MATLPIQTITTTSDLDNEFEVYYIDAETDSITITIPFFPEEGVNFIIRRCDVSSNNVIINTVDGIKIDGLLSISLLPNDSIKFIGYKDEWTTINLRNTGPTGPTGPRGNGNNTAIYFSNGGNTIDRRGEFIGQGVAKRDFDEIQLIVASPSTAINISAVKDGSSGGTVTLYRNGNPTTLSVSLSGEGIQKNQNIGSITLNALDLISVKMEPDSGDWSYGAATIIVE